jgi:hypothetical protein
MATRPPDFVIGGQDDPYLLRWFVTPWRRWFRDVDRLTWWQRPLRAITSRLPAIYLHQFCRPDDDRALHDHPWPWASLLLDGAYTEHTIAAGGIHQRRRYTAGSFRMHRPRFAHRIELDQSQVCTHFRPCITLFFVGPRLRDWGFHCPDAGWIPWQRFTAEDDAGQVGRGCEQ